MQAIRNHWAVENQHQIRDVTFKEDKMRISDGWLNRVVATLRTASIEIIRKAKPKNFAAQVELFSDKPLVFKRFLLSINFL